MTMQDISNEYHGNLDKRNTGIHMYAPSYRKFAVQPSLVIKINFIFGSVFTATYKTLGTFLVFVLGPLSVEMAARTGAIV